MFAFDRTLTNGGEGSTTPEKSFITSDIRQTSISLREWDIPYEELNIGDKIGSGRFSTGELLNLTNSSPPR
jgi:hypothetical protein